MTCELLHKEDFIEFCRRCQSPGIWVQVGRTRQGNVFSLCHRCKESRWFDSNDIMYNQMFELTDDRFEHVAVHKLVHTVRQGYGSRDDDDLWFESRGSCDG